MTYVRKTSAELMKKADELDMLAARASRPGHANVYRRVADTNRIAAAFAKISETMDWQEAQCRKEPCPMTRSPFLVPASAVERP